MSNPDRILSTHVGALPAPAEFSSLERVDEARLRQAVHEIVRLQRDCGVDICNEGEITKGGMWVSFVNERLTGFTPSSTASAARLFRQSEDYAEFSDFYDAALRAGTLFEQTASAGAGVHRLTRQSVDWDCTGPVSYCGTDALKREIDCLRDALGDRPADSGFLTSTAPASLEPGRENHYYKSEEEFVFAIAEAMRTEYRAITDAGFQLQVDDAWLAALWDRIGVRMGLAAYQRYCRMRIEALNHALRGIRPEQVRYHLCWGSWHGPHAHDMPLRDVVDIMLSVNAQTYLFEAANVRHEHEYVLWKSVQLPSDKILAPGVVSHATALIEHPDLVAERVVRFAHIVGRERVIASTDCGLGLRCHPQIAWAKLKALSRGASLASEQLWGSHRPGPFRLDPVAGGGA